MERYRAAFHMLVIADNRAEKSSEGVSTDAGPLLTGVFRAQGLDEVASSYPAIEAHAAAVVDATARLGDPLVWPVDAVGERLAGAATVVGQGHVRVRGWSSPIVGERVLLLAGALVTPLPLLAVAEQARLLGAVEIFACAL